MSLRTARTVTSKALALLVAGLVVVILGLSVVIPAVGGGTSYTILTGSMEPHMPPGTLVVTKPKPVGEIRIGDVLTYQIESGKPAVATHRVVGVRVDMTGERSFTLQGDSNSAPDPNPVKPVQIRGARWYAVPYLAAPSLLVGGDVRQGVVMGSVVILLGYAGFSFMGAARDRAQSRRPADEADVRPVPMEVGA